MNKTPKDGRKKSMTAELKKVTIKSITGPHEYYKKYGTWSAAIRQLSGEGLTTAEIATTLGKRYQHVRNVLTRPMKRGPQGRSKG